MTTSASAGPQAPAPEDLRRLADDSKLLYEIARRAIEDHLIEWRDERRSAPFRNNGLVIKEMDGTDSDVIRFGPETAMRIGLRALADHLEQSQPSQPQPYALPTLSPDYDDGVPVPGTLGAGWDISFGCRMNFGPDPDGTLRVDVHVSDAARRDGRRDGVARTPVSPDHLRMLAGYLCAVAQDQERGR